jgi:hypothetical protein
MTSSVDTDRIIKIKYHNPEGQTPNYLASFSRAQQYSRFSACSEHAVNGTLLYTSG